MIILTKVLDLVTEHARQCSPEECCGILLFSRGETTVNHALRAENEEKLFPAQRYFLGRRAHLEAVRLETDGQFRIAGYYHSHPAGGVEPSALDVKLAVPGVNYLIISLGGKRVRYALWNLSGDHLEPESLKVLAENG